MLQFRDYVLGAVGVVFIFITTEMALFLGTHFAALAEFIWKGIW